MARELDEQASRRPDWDGELGEPVRLANGQVWTLPLPTCVEVRHEIGGDGGLMARLVYSIRGDVYEDLNQAIRDVYSAWADGSDSGQPADLAPMLRYAAMLLLSNYDITANDCRWLMIEGFDAKDAESGPLAGDGPAILSLALAIGRLVGMTIERRHVEGSKIRGRRRPEDN